MKSERVKTVYYFSKPAYGENRKLTLRKYLLSVPAGKISRSSVIFLQQSQWKCMFVRIMCNNTLPWVLLSFTGLPLDICCPIWWLFCDLFFHCKHFGKYWGLDQQWNMTWHAQVGWKKKRETMLANTIS